VYAQSSSSTSSSNESKHFVLTILPGERSFLGFLLSSIGLSSGSVFRFLADLKIIFPLSISSLSSRSRIRSSSCFASSAVRSPDLRTTTVGCSSLLSSGNSSSSPLSYTSLLIKQEIKYQLEIIKQYQTRQPSYYTLVSTVGPSL